MAKNNKDDVYILKIVLFMILGSAWVKITDGQTMQIPIPVGLIIGILFARHEHFKIDRKIEYAVLMVAAFIGFWLPIGLFINV